MQVTLLIALCILIVFNYLSNPLRLSVENDIGHRCKL